MNEKGLDRARPFRFGEGRGYFLWWRWMPFQNGM